MTSLTNEQIVAEIKWAEKIVFDVTGLKTKYWRPPYGDVDNRVREIARQLGYITVIWTKDWDSNDWQISDKSITTQEIFRNFKWALSTIPKLKAGVITLEHDLETQEVNVAGPLLDMGMKKGLEPMDIARCLSDPNPYQNSLVQKPVAKKPAPTPAAAVKPAAHAPAQKPLEAPKVVEAENIPSKGDTSTEEQTIEGAGSKKSDAVRASWVVSSLVLIAASAFMAL